MTVKEGQEVVLRASRPAGTYLCSLMTFMVELRAQSDLRQRSEVLNSGGAGRKDTHSPPKRLCYNQRCCLMDTRITFTTQPQMRQLIKGIYLCLMMFPALRFPHLPEADAQSVDCGGSINITTTWLHNDLNSHGLLEIRILINH